jgi:hypothetical protein
MDEQGAGTALLRGIFEPSGGGLLLLPSGDPEFRNFDNPGIKKRRHAPKKALTVADPIPLSR